ncbi:MAG: glycosyltransferase, partial [Chloroflexus sp.]
ILGAGVAGLSVAYFLKQRGIPSLVLEKDSQYGGLARSFRWNGFWCDFSAHRFYAQNQEVLDRVRSITPLIEHYRKSQIFFNQRWLRDPVDIVELIANVPPAKGFKIISDYVARKQTLHDDSFKNYVLKRYGHTLYELFFRHYTERLFSIPGHEIAVEWAIWKVRLSSPLDRLRPPSRTKFHRFYYPVSGGYGAIVHQLYDKVQEQVLLCSQVTRLVRNDVGQIIGVVYRTNGSEHIVYADQIISTLPLTVNARLFGHQVNLSYQKVDAVYLLLNKSRMTKNHWLYFMDEQSTINRVVEFKNMSEHNTPSNTTAVCAEVTREVSNPIELVITDLIRSRLIQQTEVLDATVIREPFAYPRYTRGYPSELRRFQEQLLLYPNFRVIGRAAQFTHYEVDDLIDHSYQLVQDVSQTQPYTIYSNANQSTVWIVVLTLNNYHDTAECLQSLGRLQYRPCKIVVVDNGSSDDTPNLVRKQFPEVTVIENGTNLGVPKGYNVGIRYALDHGAEYVFILNNDTVVDPEMIDHLVRAAQEPNAGILMPIVYYYHDQKSVWSAGARYRSFPPAIVMEKRIFTTNIDLQYAISCGFLVTRRTFEMVGLLDENFRFLWDDLEFSQRVRVAGLRIIQVPRAHMWHKVSRTTNPASELFWQTHGESSVIFFRRHGHRYKLPTFVYVGYFALREFVFKRRWKSLPSFLRGIRDGMSKSLADVPLLKDRASYP